MATSLRDMIRAIGNDNQAQAARILGLSRTTVSAAFNGGHISAATARKIRSGYAAVSRKEAQDGAAVVAGTWAVGLPETRSADKEIRGECVVSHLREPAFSLYVALRYGDDAAEPEMILTRVTGSKRGVGSLLETAREKALTFMAQQNVGQQDAAMVDHIHRAYASRGFSLKEAREARWSDILHTLDSIDKSEVAAAHKIADRLAEESRKPRQGLGEMTARDNEAYEAGRMAGMLEMRAAVIRELLDGERRAEAKPVGMLLLKRELAHPDTVRGGRQSDDQVCARIEAFRAEVRAELLEEGVVVGEDLIPDDAEWLAVSAVAAAINEAEGVVACASGKTGRADVQEAKEGLKITIRSASANSDKAASFRGDGQGSVANG